uniref:Thioredoxin domain-containing protein n=1 Tax=Capra hircus TaxID=9925 RepID=A0A8C2RMV4_CAPHI
PCPGPAPLGRAGGAWPAWEPQSPGSKRSPEVRPDFALAGGLDPAACGPARRFPFSPASEPSGEALRCCPAPFLPFSYQESRAKDVIIPAKPPVSFFSSRSPVLDLFQGQLDYAEHIRRDSEVVLLFFYAPWCGQSITARAEIEQAASRLSDQVLFVAINCWWNQGKCRKQKHFFYFPVIYLYHRSFGPIEYKGPMSAVYIEKFVRRVMKPLLYIPSQSELLDFLSNYEPGVLGYFEFSSSPQPPGYLTFFTSALHSLKKDGVLWCCYLLGQSRQDTKRSLHE